MAPNFPSENPWSNERTTNSATFVKEKNTSTKILVVFKIPVASDKRMNKKRNTCRDMSSCRAYQKKATMWCKGKGERNYYIHPSQRRTRIIPSPFLVTWWLYLLEDNGAMLVGWRVWRYTARMKWNFYFKMAQRRHFDGVHIGIFGENCYGKWC